jgi:hypothetical protein
MDRTKYIFASTPRMSRKPGPFTTLSNMLRNMSLKAGKCWSLKELPGKLSSGVLKTNTKRYLLPEGCGKRRVIEMVSVPT